MINLLILYELNKSPLTMYGISRQIKNRFSVFMLPSMGTLQPALKKFERNGLVTAQKLMSSGGRPSICYAITEKGKAALVKELISPVAENPVQFLVSARVKLCCSEVLKTDDYCAMLKILKRKTENLMLDTKRMQENKNIPDGSEIIYDNLACEYRNFLSLLEGLEHACNG